MNIHTATSSEQAQEQASHKIISTLQEAASPTLLLLSGGSAIGLYDQIAEQIATGKLSDLKIGLIDERYGEPDHSHSNQRLINEQSTLLSVAYQHGVEWRGVLHGGSLEDDAMGYQEWLRQQFAHCQSSLGILGMGVDGHTAGIFPSQSDQFKQQFQNPPQLVVGYESGTEHNQRITLTLPALQQLTNIVLVATGAQKQHVFRESLSDKVELSSAPVKFVASHPQTDIYLSE